MCEKMDAYDDEESVVRRIVTMIAPTTIADKAVELIREVAMALAEWSEEAVWNLCEPGSPHWKL